MPRMKPRTPRWTCDNRRAWTKLGGFRFSQIGRKVPRATRSLNLEVLRGRLSAVLDEFVLNGLTFVQRAKSGAFDRRDVYEHILPAFLGLDEAIALRRIEPLYGALRHARSPKYYRVTPIVWHTLQPPNKVPGGHIL